jgi:hypothetical protein
MKILKTHLEDLRAEAHYQFFLLVEGLFGANPGVVAIVPTLLPDLNNLIVLEGQLVDAVKGSKFTEELADTDRKLDQYIVGFNNAIFSYLHHFDPTLVEAAKAIEVRLKAFRGSIEKKSYEEEAAAVKILVADLETTYRPQIDDLRLNDWVTEIAHAQNNFEQLFIQRNTELANRPQERLHDVRKEVDTLYRQIVERIDAYTTLNGDATCRNFITELNREVTYFNEHTHHHAKKDIRTATVATIEDQPYRDEPVIVLPDVTYEEKRLIFSRDYEVSYKNNDRPGTATLIIHGKGRFKNTLAITFNIYEPRN